MRGTAVALAVTVAVMATGCGDGLPDIDTAPALDALGATIATATTGPGASLDACPISDVDVLIDQAFALVDDDATRAALERGDAYAQLQTLGSSPVVSCGRSAGAGLSVGFVIGPGDESIDAHVERLAESGIEPEIDLTVRADHRGGQVARFCLHYSSEPSLDICEVVWTNASLFVATFVGGSDASEVDLAAVEERFLPVLQLVLEATADE